MSATIIPLKGITPTIGKECFLADGARIIGDVEIGDNSSIWFNAVLRGDVGPIRIGHHTNVQDGCVIHTQQGTSEAVLGNYVSIGHNVTLHGAIVHDYALIGMGSVLLDNVEVGEGAIVAAGSVVLKNTKIEPHTLWGGYPAHFIKKISPEQSKQMNYNTAHGYATYASWYLHPEETI